MKSPVKPPSIHELWSQASVNRRLIDLLLKVRGPLANGKYLHWDTLRHLAPPDGMSAREWWLAVKVSRTNAAKSVPLLDKQGHAFSYVMADPIPEHLHRIDLYAGGHIRAPEQIINVETKDQYYISSLMEEAITSSQLEGAITTRPVAKEMLRTARLPRDRSERMIVNNFKTMQQIAKLKNEPLSRELVFEIHRTITDRSLDDPGAAGRFRSSDEPIEVRGDDGTVHHVPPAPAELERRMEAMCAFANGESPGGFVHPALRSIILHFWLAYDHPFVDGNGRTARALFYWSMLRHGFWLCEFLSISSILRKQAGRYYEAFLLTETDENDLTYFVLYHLDVLDRAIVELHEYINRKSQEVQRVERELRGSAVLNYRQRALISHALRHPKHRYTVESHRNSHGIAYETARTDLLNLAARGLLEARKVGKTWYFEPVPNTEERLAALA